VHEPQLGQRVERAVDAGQAHAAVRAAQLGVQLLGAATAALTGQQLHDLPARAAGPVTLGGEPSGRVLEPVVVTHAPSLAQ
jgi:hypothetical protein